MAGGGAGCSWQEGEHAWQGGVHALQGGVHGGGMHGRRVHA